MRCSLALFGRILLTFLISAPPAQAQQATKAETIKVCTLTVTGMTCAGCEAAVKNAAQTIDGVKDVKASYDRRNAEVTYDTTKTTPEAIAKIITERSGFNATPQSDKKK